MANAQVETVVSAAEKFKLFVAALLVLAGFVAFYFMSVYGGLAQWGGLAGGVVLAAVVFFTSETGRRLLAYARDSWRETQKVVWPTRKETIQTTAFVFAFTVALALFMWLVDVILRWALFDLFLMR